MASSFPTRSAWVPPASAASWPSPGRCSRSCALQRHVGRAAHTPTELKQAFSWLAIGPAFSNFVGPFAAGLVIDHASFRASFLMMALFPLVTWYFVRQSHELP